MIEILKPDTASIQAELKKAKERLEQKPTAWTRLEPVGRCLHWLHDPSAVEYFQKAVAQYKLRDNDPGGLVHIGNLCRLSGDPAQAHHYFAQAHALYEERVGRAPDSLLEIAHMIPVSFMLNQDAEVRKLANDLRSLERDRGLVVYAIEKLSLARESGDQTFVEQALTDIAAMIRAERAQVWNSGGITLWDWYEIATQLYAAV